MAAEAKAVKGKVQKQKTIRQIAEEAQDYIRKTLPLGPSNRDMPTYTTLHEKLCELMYKVVFPIGESLKTPALMAPDWAKKAEKTIECKKETLRFFLEYLKIEIEKKNCNFTKKETALLPAYIAFVLQRIFFCYDANIANEVSDRASFEEIKKLMDIAAVVGTAGCYVYAALGYFYIFKHYPERQDLYPIYKVIISDNLNNSHNTHVFFVLNFDPNNTDPAKPYVQCDFWNDIVGNINDIIKVMPQPFKDFATQGMMGHGPICDYPFTERVKNIINSDNPYQALRPLFHYVIKDAFEILTKRKFPEKYYLLEDESVAPKEKVFEVSLSETEKKEFHDWYKGLMATKRIPDDEKMQGKQKPPAVLLSGAAQSLNAKKDSKDINEAGNNDAGKGPNMDSVDDKPRDTAKKKKKKKKR